MKKIKILKKIHNKEIKDVYDIEVKNDHHYVLENGVISHNSGQEFAASIQIVMEKTKLKVDDEGNKISEIRGIRSRVMCRKTRFNKPFEQIKIDIPYETGMNPYSGLIEMFEEKGLLVKVGNKLAYTDLSGNTESWFRKQIIRDNTILDKIMEEFPEKMKQMGKDSKGKIVELSESEVVEKLENE